MDQASWDDRLSRITTLWSVIHEAHGQATDAVASAQARLMQRYSGAVYRYLLGALRDPDAAEELFQEFALRLVRGDFRRADPERGRFRDFVKTVLFHLVVDHRQRRQGRAISLPPEGLGPGTGDPGTPEDDREFLQSWRDDLLARTWGALADLERQTGQPFYTVLRFRADHPELRSPQIAEQLGAREGKQLTAEGVRQMLHRARERFAGLLLDEVAQTLDDPTQEGLEQELIDLGLLEYCRSALKRRGRTG